MFDTAIHSYQLAIGNPSRQTCVGLAGWCYRGEGVIPESMVQYSANRKSPFLFGECVSETSENDSFHDKTDQRVARLMDMPFIWEVERFA